jgi:hypothetical protein
MFVTLKVFKLIGPSNDGRRHGRGTYLLLDTFILLNNEAVVYYCKLSRRFGIPHSTSYADPEKPSILLLQNFYLFIILISVLENVPPDAGLQKKPLFRTNRRSIWPGIEPGPPAWHAATLTAQPSTTTPHSESRPVF